MKTGDDPKAMVEAVRGRHSLLAAYLEAVHEFDWQALGKAAAIVDLAADANPEASKRMNLSPVLDRVGALHE